MGRHNDTPNNLNYIAPDGSYHEAVLDYLFNIQENTGGAPDSNLWNKFGYNEDVDSASPEVIASWGGIFTPLTTATTLTIVSNSANDITSTGTGVQDVVIYGIDADRNEQIEIVNMNGNTPVVTTSEWLGINRVAMFKCGSGKVNDGTLIVTATTGGSIMAEMPAGGGVTQQCIFHVPAGKVFITKWLFLNVLNRSKNAELTIKMWVYSAVSNGVQEVF